MIPIENIETKLIDEDEKHVDYPRKLLDLLCVADLAAWSSSIMTFIGPGQVPDWSRMMLIYGPTRSATTVYIGHSTGADNQAAHFTPVGVLISYLSQKLAWEHPEYRSLADYYRLTNFSGSGKGAMRKWDASIYSEEIRPRIQQELLSNGASWDE